MQRIPLFILAGGSLLVALPGLAQQKILTEAEIRQIVREEVANSLRQQGRSDTATTPTKARASNSGEAPATSPDNTSSSVEPPERKSWERVDVTGIATLEEQINHIVAQYAHMSSYPEGNPVAQQLAEYGRDARDVLYEELQEISPSSDSFVMEYLLLDALGRIITREDKDFLLKDYRSDYPRLQHIIRRYRFPETGDIALERLKDEERSLGYLQLLTALDFHAEEAVPYFLQALARGDARNAQTITEELDRMGIDYTAQLREGRKAESEYDHLNGMMAAIFLRNGLPEGLELAAEALEDPSENPAFTISNLEFLRVALRHHAGWVGADSEFRGWLEEHRDDLIWNEHTEKFEKRRKSDQQ